MCQFRRVVMDLMSRSSRSAYKDRRHNRRLPWLREIRFRTDLGVFRVGQIANVSSRGLGLWLPFPVAENSLIQLHYYSDRLAPHGLMGQVVRCSPGARGYSVGIRLQLASKADTVPFLRTLRKLEEAAVLGSSRWTGSREVP